MAEVWPKKFLYDDDGLPIDPSDKERPLDRDLRAGKVIPPVELLYKDPKAFEAFLEGLKNLSDEELRNRLSVFTGQNYWKNFVELIHTKRWYIEKDNKGQLADDASVALRNFVLESSGLDLNMHSKLSLVKPLTMLVAQYILGNYAIYKNKKMIEQTDKINTILRRVSKVLFDDEEALLRDVLADLDTKV